MRYQWGVKDSWCSWCGSTPKRKMPQGKTLVIADALSRIETTSWRPSSVTTSMPLLTGGLYHNTSCKGQPHRDEQLKVNEICLCKINVGLKVHSRAWGQLQVWQQSWDWSCCEYDLRDRPANDHMNLKIFVGHVCKASADSLCYCSGNVTGLVGKTPLWFPSFLILRQWLMKVIN